MLINFNFVSVASLKSYTTFSWPFFLNEAASFSASFSLPLDRGQERLLANLPNPGPPTWPWVCPRRMIIVNSEASSPQTLLIKLASLFCLPLEPEKPVEPENPVEPIGCFTEAKKRHLPVVYHTINEVGKKCPGILAVYEECKQKAAESSKHLEIFGIWRNKKSAKCVTTETGKFDEYFNKAPDSSNCKTCEGKGIGSKKAAVFVYKK